MTREEWKEIPGYEGYYMAHPSGRIKSITRIVESSFGRTQTKKSRELKQGINKAGYFFVCLCKNGESKPISVHRIIAKCFIPPVAGKIYVDHINGDRLDNRAENLRWCSHRENDNYEIARHRKSNSALNSYGKTIIQYDTSMNKVGEYKGFSNAGKATGINTSNICRSCRNMKLKAGGYYWRYKI